MALFTMGVVVHGDQQVAPWPALALALSLLTHAPRALDLTTLARLAACGRAPRRAVLLALACEPGVADGQADGQKDNLIGAPRVPLSARQQKRVSAAWRDFASGELTSIAAAVLTVCPPDAARGAALEQQLRAATNSGEMAAATAARRRPAAEEDDDRLPPHDGCDDATAGGGGSAFAHDGARGHYAQARS